MELQRAAGCRSGRVLPHYRSIHSRDHYAVSDVSNGGGLPKQQTLGLHCFYGNREQAAEPFRSWNDGELDSHQEHGGSRVDCLAKGGLVQRFSEHLGRSRHPNSSSWGPDFSLRNLCSLASDQSSTSPVSPVLPYDLQSP